MNLDLVGVLEANTDHPRFGPTIQEALKMLAQSHAVSQHLSSNRQSSLIPARIWRTKRSMGKLRAEAFRGIDETIESLESVDQDVQLGSIETNSGLVGIWLAYQKCEIAGVIVGCPDWSTADEPVAEVERSRSL